LAQRADRPHDLSELSWWTISQSLLPMLIDGLSRSDVDALIGEQKTRYNAIVLQNFSFWRRIIDFHLSRRAARTVSRHIRRRARQTVPREDFLQSLLPLAQRVGVDRVAYLVSMVLAGMSGLPGITAASLLYAMHRFPHWQA
ncbi:cytochrome, partial [Streptomyces sp. IF17]|nr:cytochrome [Streptomyces alkaliphilus]